MATEHFEKLSSLEGRVALITVGYRGTGLAVAEACTETRADAANLARNFQGRWLAAERLEDRHGIKMAAKSIDVRDYKSVEHIVEETAAEPCRIDIVVNSAGILGSDKHGELKFSAPYPATCRVYMADCEIYIGEGRSIV